MWRGVAGGVRGGEDLIEPLALSSPLLVCHHVEVHVCVGVCVCVGGGGMVITPTSSKFAAQNPGLVAK